jgi:NAD(P)-dependent dehydrogenase (short-subunit alcohol dehydrogenase family)
MEKVIKLFSLKGKNIIVAGGAGQIGFSIVKILADAGAMVYIADVDDEMGRQKISENPKIKNNVKLFKLDVTNRNDIIAFTTRLVI